jgi:formylglycine-generating enzyme required for sulfatase activity
VVQDDAEAMKWWRKAAEQGHAMAQHALKGAFSRNVTAVDLLGDVMVVDLPEDVQMEFTSIPAGSFMMGSLASERGRDWDEGQHQVTITKPFRLGVYEVTQEQWQAVMGSNPSYFKGNKKPVKKVSWDDANEFCRKLSNLTGGTFRLPTEAEWEYACRAGTTTAFNTGETISTDQANYNGNYTYGNGRKGVDRERTTPVGSFKSNAWGLYDMHGNVWEWCSDWHGDYLKGSVSDPKGPGNGRNRVLRGGSWYNDPEYCRSAYRDGFAPGFRSLNYYGFRVALD